MRGALSERAKPTEEKPCLNRSHSKRRPGDHTAFVIVAISELCSLRVKHIVFGKHHAKLQLVFGTNSGHVRVWQCLKLLDGKCVGQVLFAKIFG